ncbi:hypothetical protein [Streptomyces sp. NPDC051561]|uniref:hypothetical protein n=1 Tax=Streptomyces sp. NPDC051561 TaxID=3365658 RepID=UPI0037B626F7
MNEHEWQEVIGVIGIFVLLTGVAITTIWQVAISWRAKAQLSREKEYRELVEAAVTGQQKIERQLAEIGGRVEDLLSRTDSIEKVLKDVE